MSKKLSTEEVKLKLSKKNLVLIGEYKNSNTKFCCVDNYGYFYSVKFDTFLQQGTPRKFCVSNPYTIENISLYLKLNKIQFELVEGQKYTGANNKLKYICLKCREAFEKTWGGIKSGIGCPYCCGYNVGNINNLTIKRPDLLKYFENSEDAKKITPHSNKKLELKCPDCGYKKNITINSLSRQGFSCDYCSDGFSFPEKFMRNFLKSLKIKFIPQYCPSWSNGKKYDFYIEHLNLIIETHGEQHYRENKWKNKRTLLEEQCNDKIKENLAKKNGYCYVVIDCREINLSFLKKEYEKQLSEYFELKQINWRKLYKESQNSLCKNVWVLFENNTRLVEISKILSISKNTVINYLHKGNEIGIIAYNPHKNGITKTTKSIQQYSLTGEFLRDWNSINSAAEFMNVDRTTISACLRKKNKTACGFVWRYKND